MLNTQHTELETSKSISQLKVLAGLNTRWIESEVEYIPVSNRTVYRVCGNYFIISTGKNKKTPEKKISGESLSHFKEIKSIWYRKSDWECIGYGQASKINSNNDSKIKNSWGVLIKHKLINQPILLTYIMGNKFVSYPNL